MTPLSWDRSRCMAAIAGVLTVVAVVVAVVLALGVGMPQGWWPHTGQAIAADTRTARHAPCALSVGPARAYCERGAAANASAGHQDVASGAWRLGTVGAGVGAFVVWRLRGADGQRRR
ncbi:hypothetical protein AB0I54_47460 [Streptomyces sp. NPDC050625]|uniref:hypothetical protein n=1 Tax=Streptomyces sp. NPDC050625 TaxID=3154629 RepID=UPI00343EC86E